MNELITNWIAQLSELSSASVSNDRISSIVIILFFSAVSYFLTKRVLFRWIKKIISKTKSTLDDVLVERKVFSRFANIIPALIIYKFLPDELAYLPYLESTVSTATAIYLVIAICLVMDALIDSALDIYRSLSLSRQIPIQNFAQVAKLIVYFVTTIIIVSLIIGESPLKLFAGLGAITAVLMLIFRDPILGFVAGLQLSYNNMVSIGDWVEIPQHNADGDILDIGLTTVKVRNFDNTVTTVPTQSLIAESFKNWRGMQESKGRRIKRAIYIDVHSIKFCDESMIHRFSKIDYIEEYIASKQRDVADHNQQNVKYAESTVNGRGLTNIGTFRAYILAYLQHHSDINNALSLMVRQLPAQATGLPLEIYAFSKVKEWVLYENIQADIFDHLLSVAIEFDLLIFQQPTGLDIRSIGKDG